MERARAVPAETGRAMIRNRDLPAHVVDDCVIAPALYTCSSTREVLHSLLEGVEWPPEPSAHIKVAGARDHEHREIETRLDKQEMSHDNLRPREWRRTRRMDVARQVRLGNRAVLVFANRG